MIFILIYITLLNFGQTEANCSIPCPKYHSQTLDCDFYDTSCFSQNQNVSSYDTKRKPARQTHLQTKFFDNGNITFTWNADTASIKYLHGFLLNISLLYGACKADNSNIVRAFIYRNRRQIEKYKNDPFSLQLKPLCPRIWRLDLHSLPRANCSQNVQHQILVLLPKHYNRKHDVPGEWKSQMAITYSYPLHYITVNFTKAPEKFNFEKYNISLYKSNTIIESKIINKNSEPFVTFKVDFSGKYIVKIQPTSNNQTSCLCGTQNNTCKSCDVTSSRELEFIDPCPKISATDSSSIVNISIALSVIAFIIFILLCACVLKCLFYKNPEKYALLLCLNDHLLHDKAVDHLIQYLEDFGVIVHHAKKFGKSVFEVYDIVLLINSTALAERQKAWAEGKDYEQFFREKHSSKLTNETFILIDELSLEKHRHQIISLKFDHIPDNTVFKHYPSEKGNFSIPRNLFNLVKNIVNASIRFRGFFKKQALKNAINNAAEYEKCNKNWFSEKYGEPLPESVISLYGKDKIHIKNIKNNFKIDYSINSCNVSELLQTLQKKNDEGLLVNLLNKNSTFSFDFENNSILSV